MKHAQFPDFCQRCGEPVEVYYAEADPHVAVCPACGWTWSPEDEPPAPPVDEREEGTPLHYLGDGIVTCARALRSMLHGVELKPIAIWWWACVFKYNWRWPWKNGVKDLIKARDCIDKLIAEVEADA